jgi:hypothetical protein
LTKNLTIDTDPRRLIWVGEEPDVGLVDEPNVVRQPVYPLPVYRVVVLKTLPYFGNLGSGRCFLAINSLMAEEALFHRRHRGGIAPGYVAVAKLTLDAHPAFIRGPRMNSVRECDRLGRSVAQTEGRIGKPGYQ